MKSIYVFLILLVIFSACDRGKEVIDDVIQEPVLPQTPMPPVEEVVPEEVMPEEVIPEITHSNALSLRLGETYRVRPSGYTEGDNGFGDSIIRQVFWGNVDYRGRPHEGVLPEDPKTHVTFNLNTDMRPYSRTLDGKPVIGWTEQNDGTGMYDEIVIRVTTGNFASETELTGGPRGDRFTYAFAQYFAIPIENLTNPDRTFEYE